MVAGRGASSEIGVSKLEDGGSSAASLRLLFLFVFRVMEFVFGSWKSAGASWTWGAGGGVAGGRGLKSSRRGGE